MKLHPFDKVVRHATKLIGPGRTAYQQFNCAHCDTKQTMDEPNKFFTKGTCEACGKETNIEKDGCNYMLALGDPKSIAEMFDVMFKKDTKR